MTFRQFKDKTFTSSQIYKVRIFDINNLRIGRFIWLAVWRYSPLWQRYDGRSLKWLAIFYQESENNREWGLVVNPQDPPLLTHFSFWLHLLQILQHSWHISPTSWEQNFQHMNLLGTYHIQTTTLSIGVKNTLGWHPPCRKTQLPMLLSKVLKRWVISFRMANWSCLAFMFCVGKYELSFLRRNGELFPI